MDTNILKMRFADIDLNDPFFNSLRADYSEFEEWFKRKFDEPAYVIFNNNQKIEGFLYLKIEEDVTNGLEPEIKADKIVKIGTLKINPHGTKLGERFLKIAFDFAIYNKASLCYVTVFKKQGALIQILNKYGFETYGTKTSNNGNELVLVKRFDSCLNDLIFDYPLIHLEGKNIFLLAIYPKYHSVMFPDSILKNEDRKIIKDISCTNSIHKIYVTRISDVRKLHKGDILLIYRTAEDGKQAEYSAVATSICVVEEIKGQNEFINFKEFYNYVSKYSVFDKDDLKVWHNKEGCYSVKMTYNSALPKRIIRKDLIERHNLDRSAYWGFIKLTLDQFKSIIKHGEVNENIIINKTRVY
ncbi:N-acetyltransferase [Acetobacterium paludosum]|uniref:N-acetyltransferase n=1 Tax=Acetobacterium paludosum TaxID=52693 RepID=A0A923KVB2_9FIRM|nr:N-acetyltransferase [Acetobacterium paludosum]MBC3886803.1 N-acetyltransferase [Acetobacterium paludosum]